MPLIVTEDQLPNVFMTASRRNYHQSMWQDVKQEALADTELQSPQTSVMTLVYAVNQSQDWELFKEHVSR